LFKSGLQSKILNIYGAESCTMCATGKPLPLGIFMTISRSLILESREPMCADKGCSEDNFFTNIHSDTAEKFRAALPLISVVDSFRRAQLVFHLACPGTCLRVESNLSISSRTLNSRLHYLIVNNTPLMACV
jgi:hypothetical protein